MDDEKGATRVSPSPAAAPPSPRPNPPTESDPEAETKRKLFSVELRPGETTIVSWKKLLKEDKKATGSSLALAGNEPAIDPVAVPAAKVQPAEGEPKDAVPPPNRFSAVIEKIERLYMGKDSSDEEELDDTPDDDQYDTEDSFIDDVELNEYFQVDKLATKHNGYFVNRGKLEGIEPCSSPNVAPKKRRRKDPTDIQSRKDHERIATEPVNMGNMRIKAAARNASLAGKKLTIPAKIPTHSGECYQDGRPKNKLDAPTESYKKVSVKVESLPSVKKSNKDALSIKTGVIPSRDFAHKSRGTSESNNDLCRTSREKGDSFHYESHPKRLLKGENDLEVSAKKRLKKRSDICDLAGLNPSGTIYPLQTVPSSSSSSMRVKTDSIVKPKGTTLERTIRDLERVVAEYRPSNLDVKEADPSSQAVKRRLPQEVKQKLAKIARLSVTRGKMSEDDLVDRLMSIVGHLVPRRTLKRNLREMVELSLSAKRQKADRFQQIKKEIHEMIRTHVLLIKSKLAEQQVGSADDFQDISHDGRRALKVKVNMDKALEDKTCELYDLYFEGMDGDKALQKRELYGQLAELWPDGYMDGLAVKDAIYRSRERRRAMLRRQKIKDEEIIKGKVPGPAIGGDWSGLVNERPPSSEPIGQLVASSVRPADSAPSSSGGSGHHRQSKNNEKDRGGSISSTAPDDIVKTIVSDPKRKMKRKSESDIEEFRPLPPKIPTHQHQPQQQVKEGKAAATDDSSIAS